MALTKVSRGLLSTGIVDNSNATAITLNADESATFAGAISVTGTATMGGLTLDGNNSYTSNIKFDYGASAPTYFSNWGYKSSSEGNKVFLTMTDGGAAKDVLVANYNGNVGIGSNSPATQLFVKSTANDANVFAVESANAAQRLQIGVNTSNGGSYIFEQKAQALRFGTSDIESMRILSNGSVVIGGTSRYAASATTIDQDGSFRSVYASGVGGDTLLGAIGGVSNGYQLTCTSGNDITYRWHTGSNNNAMTLTNAGILLVGTTSSTLGGSVVKRVGVSGSHADGSQTMTVYNSSTSCGNNGILLVGTARGANGAFDIFNCWTSAVGDKEFKVRGDGNVFADGTFSGGGADYAEFFEWLDGNSSAEDRRGYSVVLDSGKIRVATSEDDASQIIGVISANPAMIGDNDMERWRGKYLRDDFGAYDLDANGDKQLSPDYDEAQPYVPREERVEWDIVGLMGKLRIRKGQPTGSNWIKIKDISASIEEWLVR